MLFERNAILFLILLLLSVTGCKISDRLQEGEYLLTRNSVKIDRRSSGLKNLTFDPDDLSALIIQKPNKKFLGVFRYGERIYLRYADSKDTSFFLKRWIFRTFGKKPVIYDQFSTLRTIDQMKLYLNNNGYFNSRIEQELLIRRFKATSVYQITLSRPYRIRNFTYEVSDSIFLSLLHQHSGYSLIKVNDIFNVGTLDDERYRLTSLIRNNGYFYFSPDLIYYEIDSTGGDRTLEIVLKIRDASSTNDSLLKKRIQDAHCQYFIHRVSVNTAFSSLRPDTANLSMYRDSLDPGFEIIFRKQLRIKPSVLKNSILLKPGTLYSEIHQAKTYQRLSNLPLFSFTSIQFQPENRPVSDHYPPRHYLNTFINLTRRPVNSFAIETEGTTSGSKLGLGANFVYQNLNIFRGAEVFSLRLTGALEWQQGGTTDGDLVLFFNTIQTGVEVSLDIPKFVLPIAYNTSTGLSRPKTTALVGLNYQNRPDYLRYNNNASISYSWRAGEFFTHSFSPFTLNTVSIFPDSTFIQRLQQLNDPRLSNQYSDHFIQSARYTLVFNNQIRNRIQNFSYLRWNIETAGNFLHLVNYLGGSSLENAGDGQVFNIPYAQYVRSDIDYRRYLNFSENQSLVLRGVAGIGIPYGNSSVLPFEKGYYAGGANDIRGWKYRSLGPGSFRDTTGKFFERMGDLLLEMNAEYRFTLYSFLKGALFTDMGNIWLLTQSQNYPGGHFSYHDFLRQIAISSGAGIRLDFSFFIFRIDAAVPVRNPAYPENERWRLPYITTKEVIFNFGIGYPF